MVCPAAAKKDKKIESDIFLLSIIYILYVWLRPVGILPVGPKTIFEALAA
jgi:hypothetical protein